MIDGKKTSGYEIEGDAFKGICGSYDKYLKKIEKAFRVSLTYRDDELKITGNENDILNTKKLLNQLVDLYRNNQEISEQKVNYAIDLVRENSKKSVVNVDKSIICHTTLGNPITAKTFGQEEYVKMMQDKMVVFAVGTYLAMAMAINAFRNEEVSRIILTRPAIEAGEKLGFLPGDLQSKVDPYLRPLYDALYQIMGSENFQRNMERGLIEVAPLAYMRGRTLDGAYIILDEAQNTTPAQMKMFLTRIGFGSKVVVTGDETQKDLGPGQISGLEDAIKVLKGIDDIGICHLSGKDVVRHPLVQKIVKAYEINENRKKEHSRPRKAEEGRR